VTANGLLTLILFIPLAGAVAISVLGRWPNVREAATLTTATILFACVLALASSDANGTVYLAEVLPGLPFALTKEPLGIVFALLASGLWIVTSIYSIGYMRGNQEQNQTRFYACFAVSLSAAMGVALAANLFTLFICYEVLTLSTYPLVAHKETEEARRGARIYLSILLSTSIALFLLAMVWTWHLTGTLDFKTGGILRGKIDGGWLVLLVALYLFGIGKAALMPFHRWLPAAMVAPTPVSALLHAVAVVKAGVFTVLKITVYIFGIDLLRETGAGQLMMWVAAATLLTASLIAISKDNLKARLAYSTISQLAYIVLGAMLANQIAIVGAGLHMVTHAFGKITLFFCAGAIYVAAHKTEISEMNGLGRVMPVTYAAMLIGALSVIGLPPFGGAWSKWFLALGTLEAGQVTMLAVLLISSVLNVVYLLPIPIRGFFSAPAAGVPQNGIREAPLPAVLALVLTATGCILLFFFPDVVYQQLQQIFKG